MLIHLRELKAKAGEEWEWETMVSIREHVWLNAPADVVWRMVGDPTAIQEWAPSVLSSSMQGWLRTLVLKRGGTVVEEIITLDQTMRRIQYSVRDGLPVEDHRGTVDVIEASPESCLVIYSTDVTPDSMAQAVGSAISASIQVLGEKFGVTASHDLVG
jgi:hypothetical protein